MNLDDTGTIMNTDGNAVSVAESDSEEAYQTLRHQYEARLLQANLRTEAVRAGMIDLDGLRMIDPTTVKLDKDGSIVDGKDLMLRLQKKKPWLFGSMSSSSIVPPPSSTPVRQKSAMEMSDEEYASAKSAITKYSY